MPINTTQIGLLTNKKTFNQMKEKVNEIINIVNGLPSTVTGAITRLGGVIDGQSSGALLDFPSGSLYVIGAGGIGVGDFLDTAQPLNPSGKIHLHDSTSDSLLYISQNTSTKVSGITFQTGNSATSVIKTAAFMGAVSNNSTQSSMFTLLSANLNHSHNPSATFTDSGDWGTTSDLTGTARFTLISGDIKTISPHGGPSSHLNAPLRIQRAITYDPASSNSSPLLSILGYTGQASVNVPVRVVIGDKENKATQDVRRPFAVIDFLGDDANEDSATSVKGQIAAEYDTENGTNGGLKFSVRNSTGDIFSALRIAGGDDAASAGKIIVSNTAVVNAFSKENVTAIADESAQLVVRQFHNADKGFLHMGIMVQGSDTQAANEQIPVIRLENLMAADALSVRSWSAKTRKWTITVNGDSTSSGELEIKNFPEPANGWGSGNSQFRIVPGGDIDKFYFGNRTIAGQGKAAGNGASLIIAGGDASGTLGGSIVFDSPKNVVDSNAEYPVSWKQEVVLGTLKIYPSGMGGGEYTDSQVYFSKGISSNTLFGIGTAPSGILHLKRSNEWANVYIESTQANDSTKGARLELKDGSGSNNYVILNSIPDNTYSGGGFDRGRESPISMTIARSESPTSGIQHDNESIRIIRKVHSFEAPSTTANGISNYISFRNHIANSIYSNSGDNWDAVRLVARTRRGISYGYGSLGTGSTFEIWTAKNSTSNVAFAITQSGFIGAGKSDLVKDPVYSLDLVEELSANLMIGFTRTSATTNYKTWAIGSGTSFGSGYTVIGENPFVIAAPQDRFTGPSGSVQTGPGVYSTRNLIKIDRGDGGSIQRFFIGAPQVESIGALTVYTSANSSSPNWTSGTFRPRVGIANSDPSFTLGVGAESFAYGGISTYGVAPNIRIIEENSGGNTPTPLPDTNPSRFLSGADPGMKYGTKQWMFAVSNGQMFIGQSNMGRADGSGTTNNTTYDIGSKTVFFFSNTVVSNTVTTSNYPRVGTLSGGASRVYGGTDGLQYEEYMDSGSMSINGPEYPLAGGLHVGDGVRRTDITSRHHFATQVPHWNIVNGDGLQSFYGGQVRPVPGLLPSLVVTSGNPLHAANGAHTVISVMGATTSNGFASANTFKKFESIRRYKELNSSESMLQWNTVAWHDAISVDHLYAVPMPHTGGSDTAFGISTEPEANFFRDRSSKTWWERRPHPGGTQGGSQVTEYSESHLFGSSNNHVMTIHANSTFQGVHVEKGGLYANNGILAWARILPRGDYSVQFLPGNRDGAHAPNDTSNSTDAGTAGSVTIKDSHNIASIVEYTVGNYMVTFGSRQPVGNTYTVSISGTNNLFISNGQTRRKGPIETIGANELEASQSFHSVRVANSTHIGFQTKALKSDGSGNSNFDGIDEDEIYLVVIGPPNPAHWRG